MVKLGATCLAIGDEQVSKYRHLDSIEWTAQKLILLGDKHPNVDTMLSLIMPTYAGLPITNETVQTHLVSVINDAYSLGITKFVYGAPASRRDIDNLSHDETAKIFTTILNRIVHPITFYIEPLPHPVGWLETFKEVAEITKLINESLDPYSKAQVKPLFDTASYNKTVSDESRVDAKFIAEHTDRIHISNSDVEQVFSSEGELIDTEAFQLAIRAGHINDSITFSYEAIDHSNDISHVNEFIEYFSNEFKREEYEVAIIGAGIYGRYCAQKLAEQGISVVMIAKDSSTGFRQSPTGVASLVNQARVHNGYHYPRSITTAMHSVDYYQTFLDDFSDAVITDFDKMYAIPEHGSLTNAEQFEAFCKALNVPCNRFEPESVINPDTLQGCWLTEESAIDTIKMMEIMEERTEGIPLILDEVAIITHTDSTSTIETKSGVKVTSQYVINCTYAGIQNVEVAAGFDQLTPVKYEACEIALFKAPRALRGLSFTFMDGPFISFMPFSQDGLWSLTSVLHTPHYASYEPIDDVTSLQSSFAEMTQIAKKFIHPSIIDQFEYVRSEYVVKTIPSNAENDDNRLVNINWKSDRFVSILSGKLNAIYETLPTLNTIAETIKGKDND